MTSLKLGEQIEQLEKASNRLAEALALAKTEINRDATIQRFEFTFELAWKTIKTFVKTKGLDAKSPADAIRIGADLEIIENPSFWLEEVLEARNATSHLYDETIADAVYEAAKNFFLRYRSFSRR